MTKNNQAGITVEHVTKRYGHEEALKDVSGHFERGRIHGLLGRNGAGKTTLMSIICNHIFKTSGTIHIDGADPAENADLLGRTCFIHEDQRWHDVYTMRMIIGSASRFYPDWDDALADRLAARFELPLNTRARKMSRGQRSALAVTIGLSSHAQYTFLDEPYLGLDATAREIFYEELAKAQADDPRTFIMSTHLIDECAALLETVTILHEGRVMVAGDVEDATGDAWCFTGMKGEADRILAGVEILSTSTMGEMCSMVFRGKLDGEQLAALRASSTMRLRHATLQEFVSAAGAIEPQSEPHMQAQGARK